MRPKDVMAQLFTEIADSSELFRALAQRAADRDDAPSYEMIDAMPPGALAAFAGVYAVINSGVPESVRGALAVDSLIVMAGLKLQYPDTSQ